jgi:hypothetical protein
VDGCCGERLSLAAGSTASEPSFEVIPVLPRFLFRCRLFRVIVPMLASCVRVVARIRALLLGLAPVSRWKTLIRGGRCIGWSGSVVVIPSANGGGVVFSVSRFHTAASRVPISRLVIPIVYTRC